MSKVGLWAALLPGFVLVAAMSACSERDSNHASSTPPAEASRSAIPTDAPDGPGPGNEPYEGAELAALIQETIEKEGAYTLAVRQENLVLPRWGGSDGGTVTVGRVNGETIAVADLRRTGDGNYAIWLKDGQTYFRRTTCTAMARVPGGTDEVLQPFNFLQNHRIEGASKLKAATGRTALMMEMEGWGAVEIGFEPRTFRPTSVSALNATKNGKPLLWEFKDWGKAPEIEPADREFENAYDRGPGGNPC